MISVMRHADKMLQALGLAFVTEIVILVLLSAVIFGLQQIKQPEFTTSSIIQINGPLDEEKPLPAPSAPKQLSMPVIKQRTIVKSNIVKHKAVVLQPSQDQSTAQNTVSEPIKAQEVQGVSTGTHDGFTEQVSAEQGEGGKADAMTQYAAKIKAAVQSAVEYPSAAINMRTKSRARVEFSLKDGLQQNPHILISSGLGVFDRAAIRAVEIAHYPAPPLALTGQKKLFQVWVEFYR
ncbi:MAG: TonB family protein [Chlorobium sp.]|jgi:periplasmic protein TonB|nr:MAG: TonB family protein [Chlorobium sp.]